MATRKENIDIEYDEPQQEDVSGAVESNSPYESQNPADWVPPMTGADLSHFQAEKQAAGHRQRQHRQQLRRPGLPNLRFQNGLFVKEPQRNYVKNGTEMTSSVFFPSPRRPGTRCTARSSTPTRWSWNSRSGSTSTRRTSWRNCWTRATSHLRNPMMRPLPPWTRTPL